MFDLQKTSEVKQPSPPSIPTVEDDTSSICNLPTEVIMRILSKLSIKDLLGIRKLENKRIVHIVTKIIADNLGTIIEDKRVHERTKVGLIALTYGISKYDLTQKNHLALRLACKYGHISLVRALLQNEIDPATWGGLILDVSARRECTDILRLLLADKRFNLPASLFKLPIFITNRYGFTENCKLLLEDNRVCSTTRDCTLKRASSHGHTEIVKFLGSQKLRLPGKRSYFLKLIITDLLTIPLIALVTIARIVRLVSFFDFWHPNVIFLELPLKERFKITSRCLKQTILLPVLVIFRQIVTLGCIIKPSKFEMKYYMVNSLIAHSELSFFDLSHSPYWKHLQRCRKNYLILFLDLLDFEKRLSCLFFSL